MEHKWYKNAIFYSLDVETFNDANGDGIGDFQGLISKLEYLSGLGINCIWLLPFYPSPNRDNGYDIMDYFNVDPRLGTLGDFAQFLNKAEQLGIRVIIDLVVNHTSIQHPWFQQAKQNKNNPYRNYYVWSDEPVAFNKELLMFKGEEDTIWTYNEEAGQYYLHRFYKEQPDLNLNHPKVRDEILKVMEFWLRLGVNGFRVDAAQLLIESYGIDKNKEGNFISFINEMREFVQMHKKDAVLLAEVNAAPVEMKKFIGNDDRMHMLFNFYLNQYLFLSLATANKKHLHKALKSLPPLKKGEQWLNFLRHHDELNLNILSKKEKEVIADAFAPAKEMRIYNYGIRRRLAPMFNGDDKKIKLAYSILFSMPGIPLVRYGDEIGMGDNLKLKGRSSVRTPMQWSPAANAGFSNASEEELVHPVIKKGKFGYEAVNVLKLHQHQSSVLNWIEQLITTRKQCPEIGYGDLFIIPVKNQHILIHGYQWKHKKIYFLHNLSGKDHVLSKAVLKTGNKMLFELFGEEDSKKEKEKIRLKAYSYKWYYTE